MNQLPLRSFHLKNFKAVRDSGKVEFTPLTVFIGNNGSGKSSLIEGLGTLQTMVEEDLDFAMNQWHGFENIWHKGVQGKVSKSKSLTDRPCYDAPMSFDIRGRYKKQTYSAKTEIRLSVGGNELFISNENVNIGRQSKFERNAQGRLQFQATSNFEFGKISIQTNNKSQDIKVADGASIISEIPAVGDLLSDWQFVTLIPQFMGEPVPQRRTGEAVRLAKDGSNIAEYLLAIRKQDQAAFEGIIETLQYVLPYARDVQPAITSELERTVYLQLTEKEFKVPGWLMSTGTLRILSLLALLRHPDPPPVIVIEEIENGLDPRAIHLIVEEIRNAVESGKTQVIVTTHSPYFLDLLMLSQIILVERVEGEPKFTRPANREELTEWAEKFSPGKLYTMGKLSGGLHE